MYKTVYAVLCSAAADDAATAVHAIDASEAKDEEANLLSPAVNTDAPLLDDSVRCRMAGICEGLDACHRGESISCLVTIPESMALGVCILYHGL